MTEQTITVILLGLGVWTAIEALGWLGPDLPGGTFAWFATVAVAIGIGAAVAPDPVWSYFGISLVSIVAVRILVVSVLRGRFAGRSGPLERQDGEDC